MSRAHKNFALKLINWLFFIAAFFCLFIGFMFWEGLYMGGCIFNGHCDFSHWEAPGYGGFWPELRSMISYFFYYTSIGWFMLFIAIWLAIAIKRQSQQ